MAVCITCVLDVCTRILYLCVCGELTSLGGTSGVTCLTCVWLHGSCGLQLHASGGLQLLPYVAFLTVSIGALDQITGAG